MTQSRSLAVDVVVFGGGVAGLWLLARLRQSGYCALLVESGALGAGQTRYSQGIIHGGTKYALTGHVNASADAVAAMPALWRACLAGEGEVDLRGVKLLSPSQVLWSTEGVTSRLAGFFASKLMRSRMVALPAAERPPLFQDPRFKGQVYGLEEPVLDTASLVRALAEPQREAILSAPWPDGVRVAGGGAPVVELTAPDGSGLRVEAKRLVLAAGKGNGELLEAMGRERPAMQLRPLQMVMARGPLPGALYGHCLGASATPRITITTHRDGSGSTVWYLGGQIAEEGVGRSAAVQIEAARRELAELFPWVDFRGVQWATLPVDRAEPRQPGGRRPDSVFAGEEGGVITAWPTKLALAPRLAATVLELLREGGVTPGPADGVPVPWPHPGYAPLPWEEETRWT